MSGFLLLSGLNNGNSQSTVAKWKLYLFALKVVKLLSYFEWKYYTIIDFNEVDIRIYLPEKW